jgi:hypothetical protein
MLSGSPSLAEAANPDSPTLSIVATSRNDDHGGNLLGRMELFVSGLSQQARRHRLDAELIVVEWNPPPDRPRLAQALSWPTEAGPCAVRIIEVPPELHRRYQHSEALPLFQMIAKNVGIRRARGRFVLATCIDLLFSDELVRFLASGALEPGWLYRIDRHDVPADVPADGSIEEQLEYCRRHVIRINTRDGILKRGALPWESLGKVGSYLALLGQFVSQAWPRWPEGKTWSEVMALRSFRTFFAYQLNLMGRGVSYLKQLLWPSFLRLHLNASGDFTLMAREHWFVLHGYPELEMYSMNLDSLLCHMAYHAGIRERVLVDPMRIYHVEHTEGWSPEIERDGTLRRWLDSAGIPQLSIEQVYAWSLQMQRKQRPIVFNDETWGLALENLPETQIVARRQG